MSMTPDSTYDAAARILVTAVFLIWNLYEGSRLESAYPSTLVQLYRFPLFRFALAIAVYIAMLWCPRVGAMVALAIFFYIEDLQKLQTPWGSFSTVK